VFGGGLFPRTSNDKGVASFSAANISLVLATHLSRDERSIDVPEVHGQRELKFMFEVRQQTRPLTRFTGKPPESRMPWDVRFRLWRRSTEFWWRAGSIYCSYKWSQFFIGALGRLGALNRDAAWSSQHERASKAMYNMCSEMRGFLIKAGQFLATRADFLPEPFIRRLSKLHDDVEPITAAAAQRVVASELGIQHLDDIFECFESDPLGAASISQVHRAKLRKSIASAALGKRHRDTWVAVKVQYPDAENMMLNDLASLLILARFLQRYELKFDLESPVLELQSQIRQEFDFIREAANTERIRSLVLGSRKLRARIQVPRIYHATKRLIIMEYLDGVPIPQLEEELRRRRVRIPARLERMLERNLMDSIALVYGKMLLGKGFFQADPHPGNMLVLQRNWSGNRSFFTGTLAYLGLVEPTIQLGLLDFGQCKQLTPERLRQLRALMRAMYRGHHVAAAFFDLGIALEREPEFYDPNDVAILAYSMFDTRPLPAGRSISPFDPNCPLKQTPVRHLPGDLFFVLRTIQILRGLQSRMQSRQCLNTSLAKEWCGRWGLCAD
jgi:aarF domain-containing kinase